MAPGGTCTIAVVYTPAAGASSATLTIPTNAGPQDVVLSGQSVPAATMSPASSATAPASSGRCWSATTSTAKTFTLTNTGGAPLTLAGLSITPNPNDFAVSPSSTCTTGAVINPAASCTAVVTYAPTSPVVGTATLSFDDDAADSPQNVFLTGTGTQPAVSMTTPNPFPNTAVGSTSTAQTVTITNSGTAPLHISGVGNAGPNPADYPQSDNCFGAGATFTLNPNTSCQATVSFAPTAAGSRKALLQVTDDAPGSPHSVPLTGLGLAPAATVPGAPTVGTATAGNAAATVTWTAPTSTGGSAITGYSVRTFTGATLVKTTPVGNVTSTVITGLANGTAYTFDVAAINAAGTSTPSTRTSAVTPAAAPVVSIPTVTTKNPATGATGIALGSTTVRTPLTATFSETVTGLPTTAAATANFTLKQGATAIASKVAYNATTRVATLTPDAPLLADKTYTLSLTAAIKSTSGGALAAQSWTFITGPRPTVSTTNPASGATGIALGSTTVRTPLTATFSETVTGLPTTAAATANFTLKQGATAIASKVAYNATTRVATLTPDAPLLADKTYTLSLTAAIKDVAGNPITAKTWTFITGPRPTVTAHTPATGATGVARTANISATFSEAITGIPTTAAAAATFTIKQTSTGTAFASVAGYNTDHPGRHPEPDRHPAREHPIHRHPDQRHQGPSRQPPHHTHLDLHHRHHLNPGSQHLGRPRHAARPLCFVAEEPCGTPHSSENTDFDVAVPGEQA